MCSSSIRLAFGTGLQIGFVEIVLAANFRNLTALPILDIDNDVHVVIINAQAV